LTLNSDSLPGCFQVLEPRVLDFNHVVGEDVQVHVELGKVARMVRADPHQLEQVIMNRRAQAKRYWCLSGSAGASTWC
jgi:hypothetical protein